MIDLHNRRAFLRAAVAASATWAVADLIEVEEALAWAQQAADGHQATTAAGTRAISVLTRAQADAIDALTTRILPSTDGRPGAHEAGVVYFIDRSLATFNRSQKKLYADGVTDLNRRAARKWRGATSFAGLSPAQQDDLLRDVETSAFFQTARFDTIVGTFALPTWGGNRDYAGWHMLGFEHQPRFQAPFGFYDADVNRRS
jgi:gluconate 2-dehydrogenase gamma chain